VRAALGAQTHLPSRRPEYFGPPLHLAPVQVGPWHVEPEPMAQHCRAGVHALRDQRDHHVLESPLGPCHPDVTSETSASSSVGTWLVDLGEVHVVSAVRRPALLRLLAWRPRTQVIAEPGPAVGRRVALPPASFHAGGLSDIQTLASRRPTSTTYARAEPASPHLPSRLSREGYRSPIGCCVASDRGGSKHLRS
jgi:hypothetical protein